MTIEIEYECADGTPLLARFKDAEQTAKRWRIEREHNPDPLTTLTRGLGRLGKPGGRRVYSEMDVPVPAMFDDGPDVDRFNYVSEDPVDPASMGEFVTAIGRLVTEHGSALALWHDYCLPRTKDAVAFLDSAGPETTLAATAEMHDYGIQMTMLPAFVCFNDHSLLAAACADVAGEEAPFVAYELTQGYENCTLGADQGLFELGRQVLASNALSAALHSDNPARAMQELRNAGTEPEFFEALDAFLVEFGRRAETWDIAFPTWDEQQNGFWRQLAQMASPDTPAPAEALERAAQRRESLAAEIAAQLDDDKRARFGRRYERIQHYVAIREERALWQLILVGALRSFALRKGGRLREQGLIDDDADVLHLTPDEIESSTGDLRTLVAERRAEHDGWRTKVPPQVIGGEVATQHAAPQLPSDRVLHGVAGSRGTATGPARVVIDLQDADRIEPGDVLVCVMTAPPWTPLFGVAAAVVTDTGGISSHPAIAAREYGIPCVLSTEVGTAVIPDGAIVTVDGEQGTVLVAS